MPWISGDELMELRELRTRFYALLVYLDLEVHETPATTQQTTIRKRAKPAPPGGIVLTMGGYGGGGGGGPGGGGWTPPSGRGRERDFMDSIKPATKRTPKRRRK